MLDQIAASLTARRQTRIIIDAGVGDGSIYGVYEALDRADIAYYSVAQYQIASFFPNDDRGIAVIEVLDDPKGDEIASLVRLTYNSNMSIIIVMKPSLTLLPAPFRSRYKEIKGGLSLFRRAA